MATVVDLTDELGPSDFNFKYPGGAEDRVTLDAFALSDRLAEFYVQHQAVPEHENAPAVRQILVAAGFANLPAGYAAHAVANAIMAGVKARKKKFETRLWATGDDSREWPQPIPG